MNIVLLKNVTKLYVLWEILELILFTAILVLLSASR